MRKAARGFTLIELLVVIAIIGLLMTIIMVSLGGAKAKSRDAKRQADLKNIQLALAVYYNENGMYPKNIYSTSGVAPSNGLSPNYLPVVPKDPNGSATCTDSGVAGCYKYIAYGTNSICNNSTNPPFTYHLGAAMEDTNGAWVSQDIDADTGGTYVYTGYVGCTTAVTGAQVFNGNATGCSGSTAANPDACYDVAP